MPAKPWPPSLLLVIAIVILGTDDESPSSEGVPLEVCLKRLFIHDVA